MDNRPLKFEEFEAMQKSSHIRIRNTGLWITKNEGVVVEQVIRPTGLLDPIIEIDQV
jgi:excinuclease ABC subunit B